MKDKIAKAERLQKEINRLTHFLDTVSRFDKDSEGIPAVLVKLKTKVTKEVSLFGSRWFGCGSHESEIIIPNSLRNEIRRWARARKNKAEAELKNMFKDDQESQH